MRALNVAVTNTTGVDPTAPSHILTGRYGAATPYGKTSRGIRDPLFAGVG